jgi:uncharacterized protein involved in type VI secretion and phage assembly
MTKRIGVVTAFVEEVDAEQGRVKVEYRSIQEKLMSAWAYVATPMSGKGRGQLFMPVKGDEVLVCHGDGDFDHPYVLGYLWNGEQTSPETDADHRVIVTPGNNQLCFHDKANERQVVLRSDAKRELLLDDKPSAGKVQLTSAEHHVLLDDSTGATKIEIKAGQAVGVIITLNATPQPSLSIQVGAGTTIDVSDTGVSVTSTGPLSITTAGTASINAAGAVSVTAGGVASITASAVSVNSAVATFSGVVIASTVVANAIVSPLYTPGVGNIL